MLRIQFPTEATLELGLVVTVEAQDGQILGVMVRRVFVDVVDLHPLTALTTDAAGAIRLEKYIRSHVSRDAGSVLSQKQVLFGA